MRGYNSRHIVILMSVSLMIREFIKTMLMYQLLSGSLDVVPQGDVLFPITFQGEKQIWGLLYKVQVSGGSAQPLVE